MFYKVTTIAVLAVGTACLLAAGETAQSSECADDAQQEYSRDWDRIVELGKTRDLQGLTDMAEEIESKWLSRSTRDCANLALLLCRTMCTWKFEEGRPYEFVRQYAGRMLAECDGTESEEISIEAELGLLAHLHVGVPDVKGSLSDEEWQEARRTEAERWLRAWWRLEQAASGDSSSTSLPFLNVSPPEGVPLPAGVAPSAIEDPVLRAEYEAAIEENRRNADKFNQRYKARQLQKTSWGTIENYLSQAYSIPPLNQRELEGLLSRYVSDPHTRASVVEAVGGRIEKGDVSGE